jgi:AcrR family transcriptional regulator
VPTPVRSQHRRRRAPRGAGDLLRDEILDAATELLLDTGHAKAVSIRLVAERVGVTPPSIYLHFKDKDALLDAVCARYFEKLDEQMQRAAVGRTTAMDVLRALGGAYVRFALQTPELYRIATMSEGRPGSDVDLSLNSSAFEVFTDRVLRAVCCGQIVSGVVGYDSCPRDTVERLMELRGRTDADE